MEKVTIYHKGPVGIGKIEAARVTEISEHGVTFVLRRGRRPHMLMSYYTSFWMVVAGWGHPEPDSAMVPLPSAPGVTVSRSKYRSCDPRWVSDFMEAIGGSLTPIAVYHDGITRIELGAAGTTWRRKSDGTLVRVVNVAETLDADRKPIGNSVLVERLNGSCRNWERPTFLADFAPMP